MIRNDLEGNILRLYIIIGDAVNAVLTLGHVISGVGGIPTAAEYIS